MIELSDSRIAELQAEYQAVHDEVIRRFRRGENCSNLRSLQAREQHIVRQLRRLGFGPYPGDRS